MNNRSVGIVVAMAFVLSTAIRTNAEGIHGNTDDEQAVQDAVVNFGAPQPQVPPVNQLIPDEVTIVKGGTVTFRVNGGGHGIAIYPVSKNTTRDDITNQLCIHDAAGACVEPTFANGNHEIVDGKGDVVIVTGTNPPLARIDDPTNRELGTTTILVEANGTLIPGAFHPGTTAAGAAGTQIQYRFAKTGRFLVICANRGHYMNDWMFGFVNVVGGQGQK
jgi:plastocyanin